MVYTLMVNEIQQITAANLRKTTCDVKFAAERALVAVPMLLSRAHAKM